MTEVYFHCSDASHDLIDVSRTAVTDLSEACTHALRLVHAMMAKPNAEDWRGWELRATDDLGVELFVIPFASAIGRLH